MEQLSAVRQQLERVQTQNRELEAAVRRQRGTAERLHGRAPLGCLIVVYLCTCSHSPFPPPRRGHSFLTVD